MGCLSWPTASSTPSLAFAPARSGFSTGQASAGSRGLPSCCSSVARLPGSLYAAFELVRAAVRRPRGAAPDARPSRRGGRAKLRELADLWPDHLRDRRAPSVTAALVARRPGARHRRLSDRSLRPGARVHKRACAFARRRHFWFCLLGEALPVDRGLGWPVPHEVVSRVREVCRDGWRGRRFARLAESAHQGEQVGPV